MKTVLDHVICMTTAQSLVISLIVLNSPSCSPVNPNFFRITNPINTGEERIRHGYFKMRRVKTFLFFDIVRSDKDLISMPMDKKVCMIFKISDDIHIIAIQKSS